MRASTKFTNACVLCAHLVIVCCTTMLAVAPWCNKMQQQQLLNTAPACAVLMLDLSDAGTNIKNKKTYICDCLLLVSDKG